MRVGFGYDVHRSVDGRKFVLGGVTVPYQKGLLGHSDADVLTHAVMDALLGAAALGDIGGLFPDTDPAFAGADSMALLKRVEQCLKEAGFCIGNIDATVVAQQPKLAPHIPAMRERFAEVLKVPVSCISIKATTTEGLGFPGRGDGISAYAVCMIAEERP